MKASAWRSAWGVQGLSVDSSFSCVVSFREVGTSIDRIQG